MKSARILIVITLVLYLFGCEDSGLNSRGRGGSNLALTPMENEEAELAAIHLSGELIAPFSLYRQIESDLELIRSTWADSIEHVNIVFRPFWNESRIQVYVSVATYDSMNAGEYHYWDSLNDYYRIDTITFSRSLFSDLRWADLYFRGRLNSLHLVDSYAGVPGFEAVRSTSSVAFGDRPILLLSYDGRTIKYFFRYAYGDCMAGCIYSNFFYFTVESDSAYYHGSYLTVYPPDSTRPNWADSAMQALRDYPTWNQWP